MKRLLASISFAAAVLLAGGCSSIYPNGIVYTNVKMPMEATGVKSPGLKVGKAECKSVLGIVATGDASIETAAKNGGITVIHHVDWEAETVLMGLIGTYRCFVYGE